MAEDLERKVKKGRGPITYLAGMATGAVLAFGGGMAYEHENEVLDEREHKKEITQAALRGYARKQGTDPHYNDYETVLMLSPEDMTMAGHLVKYVKDADGVVTDTIDIGPINDDLTVGYSRKEQIRRSFEEKTGDLKQRMHEGLERMEEGYDQFKEGAKEKFNNLRGREEEYERR